MYTHLSLGAVSLLFPMSFLGLPLLRGILSSGGVAPSIPLSGVLLSTPTSIRGTDTLSEQRLVPPVEASKTLGANKKESQVRWGSDLAFRLPLKPCPLLGEDPIMQQLVAWMPIGDKDHYTKSRLNKCTRSTSQRHKLDLCVEFPIEFPEFIAKQISKPECAKRTLTLHDDMP
jgi:hypothetical protein